MLWIVLSHAGNLLFRFTLRRTLGAPASHREALAEIMHRGINIFMAYMKFASEVLRASVVGGILCEPSVSPIKVYRHACIQIFDVASTY